MTTIAKETRKQKKLQTLGIEINNSAGQIVNVRNGLTDDVRYLIKATNRADEYLMLTELSEAIAELTNRAIRLNGLIADLENLRDKIAELIPEELEG